MPVTLLPAYTPTARGDVCSICGWHQRAVDETNPNGPKEQVIDTGLFIDFEGSLEICETCVVEMGHMVGMIEEPTATGLKTENAALRRRAAKADKDLAAAREAFTLATAGLQDRDRADARA